MFSRSKPKKTVRPNYISHNTCDFQSFKKWKKHYESELDDMYCIFIDNMNINFPETDLIIDEYFNLFCRMIFESSSKFIDRNL